MEMLIFILIGYFMIGLVTGSLVSRNVYREFLSLYRAPGKARGEAGTLGLFTFLFWPIVLGIWAFGAISQLLS